MADSKISQLNSADKIYDHDLMVVVTGYATEGASPDNCKISLDRIRKDVIRLDEMIFFLSGFSGYYNSGENTYTITSHHRMGNLIELDYDDVTPHIQTISTTGINLRTENLLVRDHENTWPYSGIVYNTGLNAVIGNNIEIQFSSGTPASNIYGRTEGKYKSGIISTTGLNAVTENLIARDFQSTWPHSGIIYNTGLNAVIGNNVEIQFSSGTPASNKYGNVGGKYHSGIISITGLNARTENLIVRDFESSWPYSGVIYNTGLNAVVGNNMEIQFSSSTPASNIYGKTEGKYKSGIISTTGLNARSENLIVRDFENTWPYSGIIYNTGLNARAGNNIEIDFSTNRHPNMGSPYHSGTISTTGLNMIASTGIQYRISNTWPHQYIVSELDIKIVASDTFTYGPTVTTVTVADDRLYKDIDWSLSNSKPLIDNASSYCYIVEFFIKDLNLSNVSVPSPESKGRPTTIEGSTISWSTCNTTISPATVNIGMNGNNIINTNPSSNPTYNTATNNIYLRYIEKRNLNSNTRIQPRYNLVPASYTRTCTGTYFVSVPTSENPFAGYYDTTVWSDSGILETTLSLGSYRHLKLEFAELNSTSPPAPTTSTTAEPTTTTTTTTTTASPPEGFENFIGTYLITDIVDPNRFELNCLSAFYGCSIWDLAQGSNWTMTGPIDEVTVTSDAGAVLSDTPGWLMSLEGINSGQIKIMRIYSFDNSTDYGSNGVKFNIGDTIVISLN